MTALLGLNCVGVIWCDQDFSTHAPLGQLDTQKECFAVLAFSALGRYFASSQMHHQEVCPKLLGMHAVDLGHMFFNCLGSPKTNCIHSSIALCGAEMWEDILSGNTTFPFVILEGWSSPVNHQAKT